MIFRKAIPTALIILSGIAFYSCAYENSTCNPVIPDRVSFQGDLIPLFRTYCNSPGCHSGGSPGGKLNLEDSIAYVNLSKQGSGYINITNPSHSVLYSSMISTTQPMPPSGLLDQCKIDLIIKWIEQGAKNN